MIVVLPSALKRRYLDFLDKNGISLNQPSFESLRKFVVHEINVTTSDHTCQLSRFRRETPDFEDFSRSPDLSEKSPDITI